MEGFIVRFINADGRQWVGNFQRLLSRRPNDVLLWNEANCVIVIASGAFYLIDAANPDDYYSLRFITGIRFDEHRDTLFVAESIRIHAFGRGRRQRWVRENLGGYDVKLVACCSGILLIELEAEIGEPRRTVRIRVADGVTV